MADLEIIARLKNEAKAGIGDLKTGLKEVETQVKNSDKAMNALSNTLKIGIAAGAAVGVAGLALLNKTVTKGIELAGVQQDAEVALAQTIESTGMAAGLTAEEMFKMAAGLQSVTTFGDEAIMRGQSLLATFTNIGSDVFPRVTETMLDMTEVFGSMDSAAVQLGKAINDPIQGVTALQRVGVSFTESQKEQIRVLQQSGDLLGAQTIILDELAKEFGGQARAAAETFTGRMEQLNNVVGDGYEVVGLALIPALTELAEDVLPMATEAVNTMAASLETQLIPLGNDMVDLILSTGELGGAMVGASESTLTFEEATRKTRVTVNLFQTALQFLKSPIRDVDQLKDNWLLLRSATDDATRSTDMMSYALRNLSNTAMVVATYRAEQMTAAYGGTKTALEDLEITTNKAVDETEDMALALAEEEEAALRAMQQLQRLDTQTGAYELSEGQLEAAIISRAEAQEEAIAADEAMAEELARLRDIANGVAGELSAARDALIGYFEAALDGQDITGDLNDAIWQQAVNAGLSADELITLATTTLGYSEAQAQAALESSNLRIEQDKLLTSFGNGRLSVEQFNLAMGLLEDGIVDTAEQAGYMAQTTIPGLTDSLGLAEDSAITAKDAILGISGAAEEAAGEYDIVFNVTTNGDIPQPAGGGTTGSGTGNIAPEDGFAVGGYTGDGPERGIAGPVHFKEYVFNEVATRNIGRENLETIHQAAQTGNMQSIGGNFNFSPSITVQVMGNGGGVNTNEIRQIVQGELKRSVRDAEARWRMRV